MDIGIGLPNAVRGVKRDGIVDWAWWSFSQRP
jgi:hypothetical protein